jgi:Flp pilus assembly protein TadD
MEIDPADVMLRFHLGSALLRGGRIAEAVEVLRDVVAREPHYAAPMAALGMALESLGEVEEARRTYAAFLASAPASAEAARRRVQTRLNALGAP